MRQLIFLILISSASLAQTFDQDSLLRSLKVNVAGYSDVTSDYSQANYTSLMQLQKPFIGFIGEDFERLSMVFLSAQASSDQSVITITGKSRVKENVCTYKGTLKINQVLQDKSNGQGIVTGIYHLVEDSSTQSHPGTFQGTFAIRFTPDMNNSPMPITTSEKGSWNIAFAGDWKLYKGKLKMKANWGDQRIPDSGDLDVGASSFMVNEKYRKAGWKNFLKAYSGQDPEALKKEQAVWY